ncbi:MAG TPA: TldD/PmbA family protein [Bacteriovoracaceae bacterium]|nr:TldD/PmbA family protein [Bacteriovoracaceae bacterium]
MKKIMEKVLNSVADQKADGDLIFSGSKSLKMSSQKGSISTYNVSSSQMLGIRVIKEGRVGISYTEAMDDESLKLLVKQALQNAEMNEPNEHETILDLKGQLTDEAIYPEPPVDISIKTARALSLEEGVKTLDPRVVAVPYNSYAESEYSSQYLSSRGRGTSYQDKSYSITSSALMDDKGKKSSYYDFHIAHTFEALQWNKVIETSLLHARNLLDEKSLPTGKYNVRFSEDSLKSLLECFSNFYSAKSAMDKLNPWASSLGELVMSKDLTIIDEPAHPGAFRATRFDAEGVEATSLTLVENGTLKAFIHNSMTASFYKTKTTGHAYRSPSTSLQVSGTHFVVKGKNKKPMPSKYLEVIQMDGLYSGANRVTGDFSVGVKGYVWEHGQKVMTFGGITLSGNLIEILKNVEVVGENLMASTDQSFFAVPLLFHGLSVAGTG